MLFRSPFSSDKDPVAIAGYVASNIISGVMPAITWRDFDVLDKNTITLIDVRNPAEVETGAITGAVNIPLDTLRNRLKEIPTDKPIVLYCAIGLRGYVATRILMGHGHKKVYNLIGGYKTYKTSKTPIVNPTEKPAEEPPKNPSVTSHRLQIDACGLQCPGPVMKVKQCMEGLKPGEELEVVSTDPAFARDIEAWCNTTGNKCVS